MASCLVMELYVVGDGRSVAERATEVQISPRLLTKSMHKVLVEFVYK